MSVKQGETGWDYVCPLPSGCGKDGPFRSTGWPTKKLATLRGQEHAADHEGTPMPPLGEFRAKHNLTVNADGSVS